MDRLRRSFRRKKHKDLSEEEGDPVREEGNLETGSIAAMEQASIEETEPHAVLHKEKPGRLAKIRQSFRRKKKKGKEDITKEESCVVAETAEQLDIQPFDKRSKFRRTLSFRKKKKKPTKFESDEEGVRNSRCSFRVKYLGSLEVDESRGMEVCEAAIKHLKKNKKDPVSALLHVSGDGLRVVEKKGSGMIVDQVIEKVSFCSPDRNCDKGFAYICRDGTTRRWLCHCFLAKEDSGERLSHAVGIAFSICLERKQQREVDCGVSMAYNESDGTFTKYGSFRQGTIHERIQDPQNFKVSSPTPPVLADQVDNPFKVARPQASDLMFQRQASFKGLGQLSGSSPFKRDAQYSSLRETRLPSNIERKEKSRISLILEENFEDEDLKNEIDKLMVKMSAETISKKNNNNSLTKNINTLDAFDLKPLPTSQTFPPAFGTLFQPPPSLPPPIPSLVTSPDVSLSSTLGVTSGSPFLIVGSSTGGSLELSAGEMLSPDVSVLQPPASATLSAATTGSSPSALHMAPSTASPVLDFSPAIPTQKLSPIPPHTPENAKDHVNGIEDTIAVNGGVFMEAADVNDEKNPWDFVPDQSKIKQHSRSNSKVDGCKENAAENWLASLTSKIGDVPDNSSALHGFKEKVDDEDIDSQFAELANRNKMKSTNPFRAYV